MLHLVRKRVVLLLGQEVDDEELKRELLHTQPLPYLPELKQPDGVEYATFLHVLDMCIEVGFLPLLLVRVLVDESIGLFVVNEAARNHIDVEVFAEALRVMALQSQRRSLPL